VNSAKESHEEVGLSESACILAASASRERVRPLGNRVTQSASDRGAKIDAALKLAENQPKQGKKKKFSERTTH
jgi:hypothetical protein